VLGIEGKTPALDQVAAHEGDNGGISPKDGPNGFDLKPMAPMEGVVFTNDGDSCHDSLLSKARGKWQILKKSVFFCQIPCNCR
jgi:hypothetical protein